MEEPRLSTYEHPYYMHEGNHFAGGWLFHFDSWKAFLEEWGDEDVDLNRIHRWDFSEGAISLFYVLQRKAILCSCRITVTEDDHDRIREFLKPHAELNAKLWAGVL